MSNEPKPPEDLLRALAAENTDPSPEQEATLAFLESKWIGDRHCPICKVDDWQLQEVGNIPVRIDPAAATWGIVEERRMYPLVPITCNNCGYTFFINEIWARRARGDS